MVMKKRNDFYCRYTEQEFEIPWKWLTY